MLEFVVFVLSVVAIVRAFKVRKISHDLSELKKDVQALHKRLGEISSVLTEPALASQKPLSTPPPPTAEAVSPLKTPPPPAEPVFEIHQDPLAGMDVFAPQEKKTPPEISPFSDAELEAQAMAAAEQASGEAASPPPAIPIEPLPPPPPPPRPPKARIEWERWIGVRGAALLGGIVLAIAAFLFFQYSIEKGFIKFTPTVRVVMGTLGGLLCLFLSEWTRKRKYAFVPDALSGAGIVMLYASFWAARVLYELIGFEITFVLMVLVTVVGALLSIRHSSLFVAVLGLIGGFLTPLVLSTGKDNPIGLFSYVLLLDVGFLWVAQKQRWSAVAFLALIGTFILEALWIFARMGSDRLFLGMGVLIVFAVLFAFTGSKASKKGLSSGGVQQAFGILIPFLFALYFAGNAKLGDHLTPVGGMLLLLSAMAVFIARSQGAVYLVTSSASAVMSVIGIWLVSHRLNAVTAWEVLGILSIFTLLFSFAPRLVSEEKRRPWGVSQKVAWLGANFYAVVLAGYSVWNGHFYPLFLLLTLLTLAAFFEKGLSPHWLGSLISPVGALLVGLVWFSFQSFDPSQTGLLWETLGLICLLALFYQLRVERDSSNVEKTNTTPAAVITSLGFLFLLIGAFHGKGPSAFWPYLTSWLFLAALSLRHSAFPKRGVLQLPTALLLGVGVGSVLSLTAKPSIDLFPPVSFYLVIVCTLAVLWQFLAVLRREKEDARWVEHAAAVFALLQLFFLGDSMLALKLSFLTLLSVILGLSFLIVLSATRLGQGLWYMAALAMAVFLQSFWSWEYPHLAFEAGWILQGLLLQMGAVLLFTYWPFLNERRFHADRWVWLASALAAPLWFFSLKKLFVMRWGAGFIGLLPVLLGLLSLTAASRVRRIWAEEAKRQKNYLVLFLAITLGFVSVAIPLQLKNEWVTIGWAIEGFLLILLWKRLDHAGLKYFAFALLITVTVRLIFNAEVLLYHERSGWRIVNWIMYTYWVPALALLGASFTLSPLEKDRACSWEKGFYRKGWPLMSIICAISAIAVIFVWINLAIADWYSTGSFLSLEFERHQARDLTTSIAWGVYALILLGVGMYRKSQGLRWVSLIFLVITIGKVFLYDLGELKDLYRVMSLVGLAMSLIIVSLAYQRFVFRKTPTEGK